MSMQQIRLEQKDGTLVSTVQLSASGAEPDAIVIGDQVFIRRPMRQLEPPVKNDPEVYFEATAHHMTTETHGFDKVTAGSRTEVLEKAGVPQPTRRLADTPIATE